MRRSKKHTKLVEEENLDRFADSSDDEVDGEAVKTDHAAGNNGPRDANDAREADDDDEDEEEVENDEDDDIIPKNPAATLRDDDDSSVEVRDDLDPSSKMASVMGRILGSTTTTTSSKVKGSPAINSASAVVLAKTVTPLQKLQHQEREKEKKLKEKRQANRERNLTALHLPLSIATTNSIHADGHLSVAKELEQERFHRRVATRGVVALFNAISQHQRSSTEMESNVVSNKRKETMKLTKHGFLDKIKTAAKSGQENSQGVQKTSERDPKRQSDNNDKRKDTKGTSQSSWGALKDDYMLNPKKNWDEESSEDEEGSPILEDPDVMKEEADGEDKKVPKKRQRLNGKQ